MVRKHARLVSICARGMDHELYRLVRERSELPAKNNDFLSFSMFGYLFDKRDAARNDKLVPAVEMGISINSRTDPLKNE